MMLRALGEAAVAGVERPVNLGGLSAYRARNPFSPIAAGAGEAERSSSH
jgi:hypothetical protein